MYRHYLTEPTFGNGRRRGAVAKHDGAIREWIHSVIRKWRRRKMIAALEAMDDKLLRDIGIFRGDIRHVVDGFDDRELGMTPVAAPECAVTAEAAAFRKAA